MNNKTISISIIVPVYNVQKYLKHCINSILSQSFKDFELILVNDASPDNSLKIMEEYAKNDNRITIINKEKNEGVDAARFSGLTVARGEYIMFVDSDDWIVPEALLKMYNCAKETDADVVYTAGVNRVLDRCGLIKTKRKCSVTGLITNPDLFNKYYLSFFGVNILSVSLWGKLYKKKLIDRVSVKPSRYTVGEDLYFNMLLFPHCNSIYVLNTIVYNYRAGSGTTSSIKPSYEKAESFMQSMLNLFYVKKELIEKYKYDSAWKYSLIEMKNVLRTFINMLILSKEKFENIVSEVKRITEEPCYEYVRDYYTKNPSADKFVIALVENNADVMIDVILIQIKKDRWKYLIKRLLFNIIVFL